MKQLSGLDGAFLAMETPTVTGHVGSICVLDPSTSPEPFTFERFCRQIGSRLPLVPPFRRRLVGVPLGLDQPYWIEDPDFDIEFHVRELALPAPGSHAQLAEQAARLHARPLDRSRPLWEIYLIWGLQGGRVAVYTKVHHAAIDGMSGNDILAGILDLAPEGRPVGEVPPPAPGERPPSPVELLARSAVSLAANPVRAARLAAGLLRSAPALAANPARPRLPIVDRLLRPDGEAVLSQPGLRAPQLPFNQPITQHRRYGMADAPLDEVKRIKNAAGTTVNDVVMALCAGALRRWLDEHGALPEVPLVAAVPVSVRTEEQRGKYGNRVSTMLAVVPTHLPRPWNRLLAVHEAMRAAKEQHHALPASLLSDVTQFAMPALAGQAARVAARLRLVEWVNPFNLFISNVPGPRVPLYYAGAKLVAYYPLSAISNGQGLNITVMSYLDRLYFGLTACRELVPDVDRLASYLEEELAALAAAVPSGKRQAPGKAKADRQAASKAKAEPPAASRARADGQVGQEAKAERQATPRPRSRSRPRSKASQRT